MNFFDPQFSETEEEPQEFGEEDILPLSSIINFGKYNGSTIGDVIDQDLSYARWIVDEFVARDKKYQNKLRNSFKHYIQQKICDPERPLIGFNLSQIIDNMLLYRSKKQINDNFKGYGIKLQEGEIILSREIRKFIEDMYNESPQVTGVFMDYFIRFIISKKIGKDFYDDRADSVSSISGDTHFMTRLGLPISGINLEIIKIEEYYNFSYTNPHLDYIPNLFPLSLAHFIEFGNYNKYSTEARSVYKVIVSNKNKLSQYEHELSEMFPSDKYELNPTLGYGGIGADCDLISYDSLMEIKISKKDTDRSIYQVIGYACLARKHMYKIKEVKILNFYTGKIYKLNIGEWLDDNCDKFLKFLNITS